MTGMHGARLPVLLPALSRAPTSGGGTHKRRHGARDLNPCSAGPTGLDADVSRQTDAEGPTRGRFSLVPMPASRWRLPSLGCLVMLAILIAGTFFARHQPIITGAAIFLVLVAAWF